jgi:hypothetical protein
MRNLEDETMRRTKTGFLPSVDVMESRVLLSTAAPLLSKPALSGVVRDVKAIIHTLAKTENTVQASAQLTALSSRIPSGPEALAPSWQSDIGLYRPHSARSLITTQTRILSDLHRYVQGGIHGGDPPVTESGTGGIDGGDPPVTGSGTATSTTPGTGMGGTSTPVPTPSLDSVTIQNTTGMALVVTVHLEESQFLQPFITETIPAQGNSTVLFNFGTATNAFMTMDISRADGGQSPSPFTNVNLSQPMSGYNGALFSISVIGPYFNVTDL